MSPIGNASSGPKLGRGASVPARLPFPGLACDRGRQNRMYSACARPAPAPPPDSVRRTRVGSGNRCRGGMIVHVAVALLSVAVARMAMPPLPS